MRVFCLSTGRSGTTTFYKSMTHVENYTSGHETNIGITGPGRIYYPDFHIEADNRLSWFLGSIDKKYGDDPIYIHLKRNRSDTAESFSKRLFLRSSIMSGFGYSVLMKKHIDRKDLYPIALSYVDTVNDNIDLFLKDKTKKIIINTENPYREIIKLWGMGGFQGSIDKSLEEWDNMHNAS